MRSQQHKVQMRSLVCRSLVHSTRALVFEICSSHECVRIRVLRQSCARILHEGIFPSFDFGIMHPTHAKRESLVPNLLVEANLRG